MDTVDGFLGVVLSIGLFLAPPVLVFAPIIWLIDRPTIKRLIDSSKGWSPWLRHPLAIVATLSAVGLYLLTLSRWVAIVRFVLGANYDLSWASGPTGGTSHPTLSHMALVSLSLIKDLASGTVTARNVLSVPVVAAAIYLTWFVARNVYGSINRNRRTSSDPRPQASTESVAREEPGDQQNVFRPDAQPQATAESGVRVEPGDQRHVIRPLPTWYADSLIEVRRTPQGVLVYRRRNDSSAQQPKSRLRDVFDFALLALYVLIAVVCIAPSAFFLYTLTTGLITGLTTGRLTPPSPGDLVATAFGLFIPVLFGLVGLGILSGMVWAFFGTEELRIDAQRVTWRKGVLGLHRSWDVDAARILRVYPQPHHLRLFGKRTPLQNLFGEWLTDGSLVLVHDSGRRRFGMNWDGADALRAAAAINGALSLPNEAGRLVSYQHCTVCDVELTGLNYHCTECELGYCRKCAPTTPTCLGCGNAVERDGDN